LLLLLLVVGGTAEARLGPDYYPNVTLYNQDGKPLRFYDDMIKGKVVAINFMYTSCGDSCPLETAKLRQVHRLLGKHAGKDVFMYSITVDPENDTPEVLKAYKKKFNIGPDWQFLTGKIEDIDFIRKKLGMYRDDETAVDEHAVNFVLGNEHKGVWLKRTPFDVPEALVVALLGRMQNRSLLAHMAKPDYTRAHVVADAPVGQELFTGRCVACHTIGKGHGLGPDLLGVTKRRDRAWLVRWIKEPDAMLKAKDPIATALYEQYNELAMPNIRLKEQEVKDLLEYIEKESNRQQKLAKNQGPFRMEQGGPFRAEQGGPFR